MTASRALVLSLTLLAACVPASSAWAWGATGHRLIGVAAAEALPPEIPAFLRTPDAVANIGELAREADRSKGAGNPHDADLNPGHFIDLDDQGRVAGGGPALADLPNTRAAYEALLRAAGTDGFAQGYLSYNLIGGWQQLTKDFATWRVLVSAEKRARTKSDRRWLKRDRRLREMLIVRDLGYWAHFVGDASQPLHVTMHFNGWGDFPNPKGYTTARIHGPYEEAFVRANVGLQDVRARMTPPRDCACPIQKRTVEYLSATLTQVEPLYELEKSGALKDGDPRGADFTADRLAAGASELRDLVTAAWRESATLAVGWPAVLPADVESGKVDALGSLQGLD